ncbi:ribonuclease H-like domain-containing protein [Tanacetum coccineum]
MTKKPRPPSREMLVLWNPSIRRSVSIIGSAYLCDLFGFAVVVIVPDTVGFSEIKVWKMEPNSSFTQLFTINTSCITDIVGFRKNGELVVETQKRPGWYFLFGATWANYGGASALEVYDPCSKHMTLPFLWLVIQCTKPRECESISLHEGRQVVIDGCIYRVAYEKIRLQNGSFTNQYMIVSFDLNAKEFKAIDLPDTITNPFTSPIRFIISKLKGSLVVIVPDTVGFSEIKVWKMEPNSSFTQLFTINTSSTGANNGVSSSALKLSNPCSKTITNLDVVRKNEIDNRDDATSAMMDYKAIWFFSSGQEEPAL